MGKTIDVIGQKFEQLTVLSRSGSIDNRAAWLCRCDCGGERIAVGRDLRNGTTVSCIKCSKERQGRFSHGHTRGRQCSRTYGIWRAMRTRCNNPRFAAYPNYGGRGITVCARWGLFERFIEDMGEVPAGLTIDRINNDGNYEPGNCRWATRKEQSLNTRRNRLITVDGETKCLEEWARLKGLDPMTIKSRLKKGSSLARLFDPPQNSNARKKVQL